MTIIHLLPDDEYRAHPALNISRLKLIRTSPLAFRNGSNDSPTFALGRAAHRAILEPDTFASCYARLPDEFAQRRGKEYQQWAESDGRVILTRAEYDTAVAVADSARRNTAYRRLTSGAPTEVTVMTRIRDVPIKARLDWARSTLGDVKTVAAMDIGAFFRQCVNLDYLAQFAWYSDAWHAETGERPPWKAAVIEKREPYDMAIVSFSDDDLEYGRQRYNEWLDTYLVCMERGEWPGVSGVDGVEFPFIFPSWATPRDDADGGFEGVEEGEA